MQTLGRTPECDFIMDSVVFCKVRVEVEVGMGLLLFASSHLRSLSFGIEVNDLYQRKWKNPSDG